ncbi:phosphopantetheine-binding protein [Streptomyces monticola]|uniref:Phosphopantetheine-binding protein n=1 Tax=Streptomyces monticola TaxID=2666263 RepID=A0ABW2JFQ0_9ACTN
MQHAGPITEFLVSEFLPGTTAAELDPDLDLLEHGVLDSLGVLKLISWICDGYGVRREELVLEPEHFRSVRTIDAFIVTSAHLQQVG